VAQDSFPWWAAVNTVINHLYGFIKGVEFSDIAYGCQDLKDLPDVVEYGIHIHGNARQAK